MTFRALAIKHALAFDRAAPHRPGLVDTAVWAGLAATGIGILVLIAWLLDSAGVVSVFTGLLWTKSNTGLCLVLMGMGLILQDPRSAGSSRRSGRMLIAVALFIAAFTEAQYLADISVGIGQMLFRDQVGQTGGGIAGRMAPLTSASFALIGLAVLLAPRMPRVVLTLSGIVMVVAALNIFTFVFEAAVPPVLAGYTQMAPFTAAGIAFLAIGAVGMLGPASPIALLADGSPIATVLRRLLAVLIVVPVILSWLRLEGQRLGLYDTSYGTSLFLVGVLALGIVAIFRSARWARVVEAKRAALEIERDRFFEMSVDLLSVVGADGRFQRANGAWETVLGYRADALIGRPFLELVHPDDLERTVAENERHYERGQRVEAFQNRYRHADGSYRWLEWMSQLAPDGSVAFAVARDVTDRKRRDDRRVRAQQRLETRNETLSERALRDPLTGLHNRRYFDAAIGRLERRWSRMSPDKRPPVSVLIFDLDHFGQVNKQHGHQAGDAVLRVFAALLKRRFREQDLVVRYGGEEFVAVVEGASADGATRIANEIRASLEMAPIDIGTATPLWVTVSAGCAQLGEGRDTSAGIAMADVWLSQAKRAGRNQVVGL